MKRSTAVVTLVVAALSTVAATGCSANADEPIGTYEGAQRGRGGAAAGGAAGGTIDIGNATIPADSCRYMGANGIEKLRDCAEGEYCPQNRRTGFNTRGASGDFFYGQCMPIPEGCGDEVVQQCNEASGPHRYMLEVGPSGCACVAIVGCSGICEGGGGR